MREDDFEYKEILEERDGYIKAIDTSDVVIEKWFDDKGRCIHYKEVNCDYEDWTEYDENGNDIHFKNTNDYEDWTEYDDNNKMIHYTCNYGLEEWCKYDDNGRLIECIGSTGYEEYRTYDDKGKLIDIKLINEDKIINYRKDIMFVRQYDFDYDEIIAEHECQVIYRHKDKICEVWFDLKGYKTFYKDSDGNKGWYEKGKLLYASITL